MVANKTTPTRSMRNGMTFLVTFVVFLILFGAIMIWGVSEFWRQSHGDEPAEPSPSTAPSTGYTDDDTRRLLLVTEEEGAAQGFVVLSAEPAAGRMSAVALPRETVVTQGTQQLRLFELYRERDMATVTEQVAALLDQPIDNWAVFSYDGLQKLITHLGDGVIFTLSEPVSYETADGITVHMKSGARTLTATQVTDLLRYTDWHGGRGARAQVQAELVAAVVDQYLVPSRFDEEDTDFHTIVNLCRSDIRTSQFVESRDGLLLLARRNQNDLCRVLSLEGEFVGVGESMRFEPAEGS